MDWRDLAACRTADPEAFFPNIAVGPLDTQVAAAKAVCTGCSVAAECLRWALKHGNVEGVWGGTSEDERRAIRREGRRRLNVA